jgi:myosin regulatory light chain 12
MFDQNQIQEFKEAFNMIDANKDQLIDQADLAEIYASLGKNPSDKELDDMIKMAPGPINFTMFLTMFGEKLMGTDPEDVIKNAFQCFDDNGDGKINDEYLRELLTTMGDRFTDDQVDQLFHDAPISSNGDFNYVEFTKQLKHGKKDPEDKQ